jgi:flagellar biosynthesis component FlhA
LKNQKNVSVEREVTKMRNLRYYFPGSILILIAIMIVAVPEILVAFVAALIIMVGIGALYTGHMMRKSEIEFRNFDGWFLGNDPSKWSFVRPPTSGKIYREF